MPIASRPAERRALSPQEAEAVALGAEGLPHHEIAYRMGITYCHLQSVYRRVVAKGYEKPPRGERRKPTGVLTATLLAARAKLRASGITNDNRINGILAARFDVAATTIRMRLTRHDRNEAPSANAQAGPAPG